MLKVTNLSFAYTEEPVLRELNLTVRPGEYVGIIGPNGSGKSSLIKILNGLYRNYRGTVILDDRDLGTLSARELALKVSYVPQHIETQFDFTVRELVETGRFPHQTAFSSSPRQDRSAVEQAMALTGMDEYAGRPFRQLSGGEQQRAVIAGALAQESDWMLLDEPTSALDLRHQQEIYGLLKTLCSERGKTILVVTHDINLAAQYCDRLILMHEGHILKDGAPKDVLLFPVIEEVYGVKVYIDINPMNQALYIVPYT
ncbi:MAG TPA: ABC transporter ATP-binding protein [Caldithrix abyssi]|uniref:ABC transporter ATP-binding protein n=1 Tax=Caldithrix abyssi TaxID=187145 RepID=A0A7V1PUP3_CALAY|nr:ABC transporter ATP-binding protein [Caldithrix abyssi]